MEYKQISFIHDYLVRFFEESEDPISPPGIKSEESLRSAIARPFMSVGGKDAYQGVFLKAAALFHSIINNHSFHNGNKRTALLTTIVFLSDNWWPNHELRSLRHPEGDITNYELYSPTYFLECNFKIKTIRSSKW